MCTHHRYRIFKLCSFRAWDNVFGSKHCWYNIPTESHALQRKARYSYRVKYASKKKTRYMFSSWFSVEALGGLNVSNFFSRCPKFLQIMSWAIAVCPSVLDSSVIATTKEAAERCWTSNERFVCTSIHFHGLHLPLVEIRTLCVVPQQSLENIEDDRCGLTWTTWSRL